LGKNGTGGIRYWMGGKLGGGVKFTGEPWLGGFCPFAFSQKCVVRI